jgi:hypothetical protein
MPWWRLDFWVNFRHGGQVLIKQKVTKAVCIEDYGRLLIVLVCNQDTLIVRL